MARREIMTLKIRKLLFQDPFSTRYITLFWARCWVWQRNRLRNFNLFLLLQKLSSGSTILLAITLESKMIVKNIWRRVVGNVLMNISPSTFFLTVLQPARFHQNCQAALGSCEHDLSSSVSSDMNGAENFYFRIRFLLSSCSGLGVECGKETGWETSTYSRLGASPNIVVWIYNTLSDNFGIEDDCKKYLKESCW